ncbi:hypothetical protein [Bradyrhizobium sp. BWA-3-5]|uniref:hypothetical protein n=1 Tax=Bradyrhizobium sp. BWA-3-5 TaxID=3080013 RepID=UPI00293E5494|nr:hypothetical protein [Bradyrhizobium sp. BWA-3-5]WOH66797.1 hypothetical protein RX331_03140 [Bradyrhizobium sp. BWA-3-5]
MSTLDDEDALLAGARPKALRRPLRTILLALLTQYVAIACSVGLTVAVTLHYWVTPQIVATFETLEAAFKRLPPR